MKVPAHQESDIPSKLINLSSPLPPVEIPSTEGPVLPPGLQNWSQKPYHPPSLPEPPTHHTMPKFLTFQKTVIIQHNLRPRQEYEDDDNVSYGPGTADTVEKVYLSAQQIPR
ncbi:hypothetical protein GE061_002534 [Apolygus lucorum]|uniref:Uncharacterized protein n=1 Tax=Apolygus lucorum TaxID=248454 RepID=A0A8S9X6R7_APOLU|nr:hypothetical protein GE061_002534 [Apolygus lucorum]